jgi:secreted trypsin-like serine protease
MMLRNLRYDAPAIACFALALCLLPGIRTAVLADTVVRAAPAPVDFPKPKFNTKMDRNEVAGGAPNSNRKIVGISYTDDSGTHRVCSGLWISRRFVLTAAHCTCENSRDAYLVSNGDRLEKDWRPAQLHSRFDGAICQHGRASRGNDLALLSLSSLLLPTEDGKSACLSYSLIDDVRLAGTWMLNPPARINVAGYGFVGDEPGSVGTRRSASVQVNSMSCNQRLARALGCWPLKEIILGAGETDGRIRDTCAGDSGGPAYVERDGKFLPIGIVSRGLPIPHVHPKLGECGAGGIYTLLGRTEVVEWLRGAGVPSGLQSNCQ